MSRPDFMAKQIIFVESNNNQKLKFENSNLVLIDTETNKTLLQHSCHKIFMIFVLGEYSITSVLIKNLKKYAIPIVFLNYNLRPYLTIAPDNKGNFLLRKKQYTNNVELELAKHVIKNKISNQIYLIKSLRYKTTLEKLELEKVEEKLLEVDLVNNSQELLGVEGNASKIFFEVYFKNMNFKGRRPRCKDDVYNLLLDMGYYYLFNFIEANLELYGFDNYCGFYHRFFFQRKSLVCDLVEPFRCIIDRRLRKSYNLKQITEDGFYLKNGQYYVKREFSKKYTKLFIEEILLHKEEIFMYVQSYYRSFMKEKNISEYPIFELGSEK